ncbi:MAG TPA: AAA family ATPase [Candidatus Binatia bacterium]|jgi:predicted ABC-type ATPase
MASPRQSRIYVLAGVNGAGKSSIGGATFRASGADYYNPDEAARGLMTANPTLNHADANSAAWHEGVKLLKRAIAERKDFVFETTLGANTIPRLLAQAASLGIEIYIWYVGLSSPALHIERVQARVRSGGHDIAAEHIHRRFEHSRLNLIELMPHLTALRVYDNSADADPATGKIPKPKLVLHMVRGKIRNPRDLEHTPDWARPIVAMALKLHQH